MGSAIASDAATAIMNPTTIGSRSIAAEVVSEMPSGTSRLALALLDMTVERTSAAMANTAVITVAPNDSHEINPITHSSRPESTIPLPRAMPPATSQSTCHCTFWMSLSLRTPVASSTTTGRNPMMLEVTPWKDSVIHKSTVTMNTP